MSPHEAAWAADRGTMNHDESTQADVDPNSPWMAQHAEQLSRGLNRRTPYVERQVRLFVLCVAVLALALGLSFVVTTVW